MTATSQKSRRNQGRRARRFARLWPLIEAAVDEQIRPAKAALFAELGEGQTIVEIGPGLGVNFGYYPPGSRVVAYEPNPHFAGGLTAAAEEHGIDLDLRTDDLRDQPLAADSVDTVVSTLVLCSVGDPRATLAEIHRVLRPGGRLLFVEHVAEPSGSPRRLFQRLARWPFRTLADGCDPCNSTQAALDESPFILADARFEHMGTNLDPTNLIQWGAALKAA